LAVPSDLTWMSDWYQAKPKLPWKFGFGLPLASWF
jgi:hypothetical protein